MTGIWTRRQVIKSGAALGAGLGAGMAGLPALPRAQDLPTVNYATVATGMGVIINEYMAAKRFDLKNGINLTVVNSYASVATYYNDFAAGTFDLALGAWDSYLDMYHRGVPIKLVCTVTTSHNIGIVAGKDGPSDVRELKGKNIAAVQTSGGFKMSQMVIRDFWGIDLGKDVAVDNVPSPAQAITMVMADRAAAGLSWEPNISIGLARVSGMKPIFNLGAVYAEKMKENLPNFTYAASAALLDSRPDMADRIARTFADCIRAITADPTEAFALAAPKMKVEPSVLRTAFDSGRLSFDAEAMSQPSARKLIKDAADYLHKGGALSKPVDDGFFAG